MNGVITMLKLRKLTKQMYCSKPQVSSSLFCFDLLGPHATSK
jgi:hypothetical protein